MFREVPKMQRCFFSPNLSVSTKLCYKISRQVNNVFSFRFTRRENLTIWLVWSRLILTMTRHLEMIMLLVYIRLLIQTQTTRAHLLPLAGRVKIIHFRHTPFKLNKPAVLNRELILPFQVFHTALKARNDRIVNEILCR